MLRHERIIADLMYSEDKAALAEALEAGRYLILIARRDTSGDKPLKWHFRQNDFSPGDQLLAPQQLAELVKRSTQSEHTFTVPRIDAAPSENGTDNGDA